MKAQDKKATTQGGLVYRYGDSRQECDAKLCTNSDLITQDMWISLGFYGNASMLKQIHLNSMKCEA